MLFLAGGGLEGEEGLKGMRRNNQDYEERRMAVKKNETRQNRICFFVLFLFLFFGMMNSLKSERRNPTPAL